MNTINKLAPLIVIIAIIVIGFFVYNYFIGGNDEPEETVLSPNNTNETAGLESSDTNTSVESRVIGEELVRLRRRLNRINISADIIASDRFSFLRDITEPVPNIDFGRDNPFLPAGL